MKGEEGGRVGGEEGGREGGRVGGTEQLIAILFLEVSSQCYHNSCQKEVKSCTMSCKGKYEVGKYVNFQEHVHYCQPTSKLPLTQIHTRGGRGDLLLLLHHSEHLYIFS